MRVGCCRLLDDLQGLQGQLQGPQLLKCFSLLVQLGCIRSTKQQQFLDQLLQHLAQQQLQPDPLLQLPGLIEELSSTEPVQSQPGLGSLIKKLSALQEGSTAALQSAKAEAVLRLVVGLMQQQQLQQGRQLLPELGAKLLSSIRELAGEVSAATAAAATAEAAAIEAAATAAAGATDAAEQQEQLALAAKLRQEQQVLMQFLSLQEWVCVLQAVRQLSSSASSDGSAGAAASSDMPAGGEEVAMLLQAMLDSELLHHRLQKVPAAAAAAAAGVPPPPKQQQQQEQRGSGDGRGTPPRLHSRSTPPPPPASTAPATDTKAAPNGSSGGVGSSSGGSSAGAPAPQIVLLPMVFVQNDWQQLVQLLLGCLEWYPIELLPLQLLQLVLEVGAAAAAPNNMCTNEYVTCCRVFSR